MLFKTTPGSGHKVAVTDAAGESLGFFDWNGLGKVNTLMSSDSATTESLPCPGNLVLQEQRY